MRGRRVRPWIFGFHLFELALTAGCFAAAHRLREVLQPLFARLGITSEITTPFADVAWLSAAAVGLWAILLWAFRLYRFHAPERLAAELWRLLQACALGTAGLYAGLGMAKDPHVNRSVVLLFGLVNGVVLAGERVAVRLLRRYYRRQGYDRRYILIVGTGDAARELARELHANPRTGREVVGFVSESPVAAPGGGPGTSPTADRGKGVVASASEDMPILGSVADFARVLEGRVVDEAHFVVSQEALAAMAEPLRLCEERGIQTRVALTFLPHVHGRVELEQVGEIPLLTFSTIPTNEWMLLVKRAGDVAASGLFFAVFGWWLFPLIAALIKVGSTGPVFYRQERAGLNGRRFVLYKFRTMVLDADARKAEVLALNEMSGPVFKIKNDPRITRMGRFLRRWSLDELPQLVNVLKGDMSLVGPRPLPVQEAERLDPWQRRRLGMRPGLTCLWQIGGRNTVDFARWMELDLEYIDRWSLGLDAQILLKTLPAVLTGRGAS